MDERLARENGVFRLYIIDDGLIINYEPEDESPECINFGLKIAKV